MTNPYEILGIDETASDTEIKKAYRKKAKEHHPDKGGDTGKFMAVNEAMNQLIKSVDKDAREYLIGYFNNSIASLVEGNRFNIIDDIHDKIIEIEKGIYNDLNQARYRLRKLKSLDNNVLCSDSVILFQDTLRKQILIGERHISNLEHQLKVSEATTELLNNYEVK